jgi:hypothetical protein
MAAKTYPAFLNDVVFKIVFGTEKHEALLRALVNALPGLTGPETWNRTLMVKFLVISFTEASRHHAAGGVWQAGDRGYREAWIV